MRSVQNVPTTGSHFLQADITSNCELRIHHFSSPLLERIVASRLKTMYGVNFNFRNTQSTIVTSGRINRFYGTMMKQVFAFREPSLSRRRGWVSHGVTGQTQGLSPPPRPIEDLLPFRYS